MRYEYDVTSICPVGYDSPMPDSEDLKTWLNNRSKEGWEFVSPFYRFWNDRPIPQQFYIFRRLVNAGGK